MSKYHLDVIIPGQLRRDCVSADHLEIRDGVYAFYNVAQEVDAGYVPLGASGVSLVKRMVASYPVACTIIAKVEHQKQ